MNKIKTINIGAKNGMWVGDKIGYAGLHKWVRSRIPKPELCDICKIEPPRDLANKGIYSRDLNQWEWLCRRCHMKSDGRMANLKPGQKPKVFTEEEQKLKRKIYSAKYRIEYEKINAEKIKNRKAIYRKNNLQLLRDQSKKSYYKRKLKKLASLSTDGIVQYHEIVI